MPNDVYRYALELYKEADGTRLGRVPLEPDWVPMREWAWFDALRAGREVLDRRSGDGRIAPVWHPSLGEPYLGGFRVELNDGAGEPHVAEIPSTYFARMAASLSLHYRKEGALEPGDRYAYGVLAFAGAEAASNAEPAKVAVRPTVPDFRLGTADLDAALAEATVHGLPVVGDFPVLVPADVLAEVRSHTAAAGDVETGGLLIGHLHRDAGADEVFLEVTAQVPARGTIADASSLAFTPETWNHARASLELRDRGEILCGWWHSHPVKTWCRDCPPEKRRACPLLTDFFSDQDRLLHRTVFSAAYGVALVVNELADDARTLSLFGWREGALQARAFHVTGEAACAAAADTHSEETSP